MLRPLLAEVPVAVPVAVGVGEGAAALFPLLLWGIALSLLLVWRHTLGALFQWVADEMDSVAVSIFGRTRHLFGPVSSALRSADNAIQVALSETANGAERAALYLFNQAWHTLALTGRTVWHLGYNMGAAIQGLVHQTIPQAVSAGTLRVEHDLGRLRGALTARLESLTRPLVHRLGVAEHAIEHDFGIARRGIDAVERETRTLARKAEREAARLSRVEKALGVAAFAGAVAVALERLGLRWLRCPSLLRIGRQLGCGGFSLLEDVLFGAVEVFAVSDLCRFAGLIEATAEQVRPLLLDFVDAEEALVGCHGATRPPDLSIPSLHLPPTNAGLTLAA